MISRAPSALASLMIHGLRIEKHHPLDIIGLCREGRVRCRDTDDGRLDAFSRQENAGLDPRETLAPSIQDVCREERKACRGPETVKGVPPPVEFVVPDRHGVEVQGIHDVDDRSPPKDIGQGRSLKHVPA